MSSYELFAVVISGTVNIYVNQRFALNDAAEAHRALEARATTGSTILAIQFIAEKEAVMTKSAIVSQKLAPPVGPFSQAIRTGGYIFFSGQVGQDPASGQLVQGGVVAETEQVFRNLAALLEAAGKNFNDVVRVGVFLTSMGDFATVNGIYAKHFEQPYPARTTIAAAALPLGACVEIELVVAA